MAPLQYGLGIFPSLRFTVKQPLQAIVRFAPDRYRSVAVCPAPLWDTLRVVASDPLDWASAAHARAWADGKLLPGVWTIGDDGFARCPEMAGAPACALVRAWVRPPSVLRVSRTAGAAA